jgi:NhaP-type Na+/H+ or K+/H+ antiporter
MILGIAEIIIGGMIFDWLARRTKAPGLLGLLLLGILFGPFALNLIEPGIYKVAAEMRMVALVVILFRAGFEMNRKSLQQVGTRAFLIAFIPCLCEIAVITLVAPLLLPLSTHEAAMLGAVLAAVSPAVIVPYMVKFSREKLGTDKGIPTLVLAGAACDDAVAIVLCSALTAAYAGTSVNTWTKLGSIPVSIITGVAAGVGVGYLLYQFFKLTNPRATKRLLTILALAIMLISAQQYIENWIPYSALMTILTSGVIIYEMNAKVAREISDKLAKLWIFAQLLLFVLVGAQVDVKIAWGAGLTGCTVIFIGLTARSVAVFLCLVGSQFNKKERLFVALSYLPKATVQAAIGAVPLTAMAAAKMDTEPGELILAVAVLSIITTAPLGAFLINAGGKRLLNKGLPTQKSE